MQTSHANCVAKTLIHHGSGQLKCLLLRSRGVWLLEYWQCHRQPYKMVHMSTTKSNNERLKELVEQSGLTQAVALTIFNRKIGPKPYSESAWKAFLSSPDSVRFRPLADELLAHAEKNFSKIQKTR